MTGFKDKEKEKIKYPLMFQVELTKLPESELGFQWSDTQFELPGETETLLTVTWTPIEYGSYRHNIKIVNVKNKKILSEIILISSTADPPKVIQVYKLCFGNLLAQIICF